MLLLGLMSEDALWLSGYEEKNWWQPFVSGSGLRLERHDEIWLDPKFEASFLYYPKKSEIQLWTLEALPYTI
jgi:hypothetical protein